jgi:hypothetical protein
MDNSGAGDGHDVVSFRRLLGPGNAVLDELRAFVSGSPDWDGGLHSCTWTRAAEEAPGALPSLDTLASLAATPGLWAPPDEACARALQRTYLHLVRRSVGGQQHQQERLVKSWRVTQLCNSGRRMERMLVATQVALYRCTFREGEVVDSKRVPWQFFAQAHCGPLACSTAVPRRVDAKQPGQKLPSAWTVAGWATDVLCADLDGQYALRLFNRRAPGQPPPRGHSPLAGATFWHEDVVDNGVLITFLPEAPPHVVRAGPLAVRAFSRDTAAEMALVCFGCMVQAVAQQPQQLGVTVCAAVSSMLYVAASPLLAALHLCMRGRQAAPESDERGDDGRSSGAHAGAAEAMPPPSALGSDLRGSKLTTRRCM